MATKRDKGQVVPATSGEHFMLKPVTVAATRVFRRRQLSCTLEVSLADFFAPFRPAPFHGRSSSPGTSIQNIDDPETNTSAYRANSQRNGQPTQRPDQALRLWKFDGAIGRFCKLLISCALRGGSPHWTISATGSSVKQHEPFESWEPHRTIAFHWTS
jgi:hypothetical protein